MKALGLDLDDNRSSFTVKQLTKHHLLITGQTKTTTALSLLSKLQNCNMTTIVLDPTGEYAQLPNATVYRLGENAYLDAGQLSGKQLALLTETPLTLAPLIDRAIHSLRIMQNIMGRQQVMKKIGLPINDYQNQLTQLETWAQSYPIQLLPQQLIEEMIIPYDDQQANYLLLGQQYDRQNINSHWSALSNFREKLLTPAFRTLFGIQTTAKQSLTELNFVLKIFLNQSSEHKTLVIDLSLLKRYENSQRLVISILLKQILNYRLHHYQTLPAKIVIDEAHRYLPSEEQLFQNGIFQMAREGRKFNLSLILTTQSPLDLLSRLRSQFANLIIHQLVDQEETAALGVANYHEVTQLKVGKAFIKVDNHPLQKVYIDLPEWFRKEQ